MRRILEIVASVAVIVLILLPVLFYPQLPQQIPIHFDAAGRPDAYGDRSLIWWLPAIGTVLYAGLSLLGRLPPAARPPRQASGRAAAIRYHDGKHLLQYLKAITLLLFAYLTAAKISIALRWSIGLGTAFTGFCLLAVGGLLAYYSSRWIRAGQRTE